MIKKCLFWLILIGIIFKGISLRSEVVPFPYDWADQYFRATTSYLEQGDIDFHERQPYYQLFALGVVLVFKNFSAIAYVQLFLGLITCLLILYFYLKSYDFIGRDNKFFKIFYYLSGLALFYLLYCSGEKIYHEYSFRPENFSLLIESILLCFLLLIFKKGNSRLLKIYFFWFNFWIVFVSFKFIFLAVFNIIFGSLIFIFNQRQKYPKIMIYLAIPLLVFFITNSLLTMTNSKGSNDFKSYFNSSLIFWRNIDMVRIEIEKDMHDDSFTKFDKEKLNAVLTHCNNIPPEYTNFFTTDVFNTDKILYGQYLFDFRKISTDFYEVTDFYKYYIRKSMIKHPINYLMKYLYEIFLLYKIDLSNPILYRGYSYYNYKNTAYETYRQMMDSVNTENSIIIDCYNRIKKAIENNKTVDVAKTQKIFNILSAAYSPIGVLFMFILVRSKGNKYGKIILYISIYGFLIASFSAMTYFLIHERYIFEITPLFLTSEFMMIMYIIKGITNLIFVKHTE